jgi:hypothetical protein
MLQNLPNKQIENTEQTTLAVFVNVLSLFQWQWLVHTKRRHPPTSPAISWNGKAVNLNKKQVTIYHHICKSAYQSMFHIGMPDYCFKKTRRNFSVHKLICSSSTHYISSLLLEPSTKKMYLRLSLHYDKQKMIKQQKIKGKSLSCKKL